MIYRLIYCNKDGVEARVDIQKGSSTPVIDVEGTERPFVLSYNNDKGNKSGMFLSSSADIEIYETPDFNIDNLKTSNETELSVTHYINNIVSWQGFIIPDFFSIEVRNSPVITMTASDRLGTLKNVTLSDLPTMVNIRELILTCLSKTGLSLPLKTIADFSNDGTVNAFFSYYVDSQRIKDIKGRSISCYDILSSILIASNSKLVQRSGEWVIINKLQHEIGSGKIYSSLSSSTNYLENIYNFDEVSIGARRTIMPVAGSAGIYHEHGGRKSHPANYDFSLDLSGWNSVNGFVATIENKHITGFLGGTPLFDPDRTVKQYLLNYNNWIDDTNNLNTAPYISTDPIQINSPRADRVEVTVDISSTMAEKLSSNTAISFLRYAVILTNGVKTYTLTKAGIFEILDPENISGHSLLLRGGQQSPLLLASPAFSNSDSFKGLFEVGEDDDVNNYSATIRVYGSGNQYVTVNYALIKFGDVSELPKGTMYKTEQGEVFTKAYDIETSIFGDYLLSGLDGYFYRYPNDDTSSIYKDVNTLSSPIWTTPSIPNETSELPLLHHSMRQMRRMFSVAHDLLSAEIEASNFDPLAIFVACEKRYTVVSAQFDFFKSNLSVELEEVAFQKATVRDFIYSYFGDGESGIKSIGGISGGGGGSTGGGLTPEQLEVLSFWKKDPDNPNTIFTEMNAYSKLELSAYGAGDSGGGGGSDYERLDKWADYDSSKSGWVLSAFLGNDLNTRVTAIDGRLTDLENTAGSGTVTSVGISVPTGLSVSNSPITSSGVIAIGLQTGYSIPTTAKQGQWDTAFTNNHTHANKTVLDGITSGLISNWNTAFTNSHTHANKIVLDGITSALVGNWNTAYSNTHTHSNKTVLDGITSALVGNWNTAFTNNHTHSNKAVIDQLTQGNINVLSKLSIDADGNLKIDANAYATGELSAYGAGTGGGSGSSYERLDAWADYDSTKSGWVLSALLGNELNTRVVNLEGGSALTVNTTGTGNAITAISKAGTVITADKGLTFSLSNHLHTGVYEPVFTKNTAFNKNFGATAGTVSEGNHTHTFASLTSKPTTLAGYGITDAASSTHTHAYLPLAGGTVTGDTTFANILRANSVLSLSGLSFWNVVNYNSTGTPTIIRINTRIPYTSGALMPTVHLSGYAYGKAAPIDLKVSWYVYNGNYINVGATCSGAWKPTIYLTNEGGYCSINLVGSIYYPRFTVDFFDNWSGKDRTGWATGWTVESITTLGTVNQILVPYRDAYLSADTTGNAATATKLQTARTIAGVSFDGTADIAIPFANLSSKPTTLGGYGITDAYTKTEVNSALNLKLDKSVFDDLFEKVEVSTGVFAIKAKYNFYGVGEVSAYGIGSSGGSGGGSYERLDTWADYDSSKAGWVLSAFLGTDLNTRVSSLEGGSALTVNTTGTGNAVTSISKSGTVITADKGLTFSLSNHLHSASDIISGTFAIARIPTGTTETTVALGNHLHTGVYEPVFTKNAAFNKNFGTTAGTVAQGNDSRIINGQTAFGWGNHASAGYALNSALSNYLPLAGGTMTNTNLVTNLNADLLDGLHYDDIAYGKYLGYGGTSYRFFIPFYRYDAASDGNVVIGTFTTGRGAGKTGAGSNASNVIEVFSKNQIWQTGSNNDRNYILLKSSSTGGQESNIYFATAMYNGQLWYGLRIYDFQDYGIYFKGYSSNTLTPIAYYKSYGGESILNSEIYNSITKVNPYNSISSPYYNYTKLALVTDNVASASKLQTPRTIAGVSFDGTANIAIPFANLSSKPTTLAGYGITDAVTLNTAQTITGAKTFSKALTASISVTTPKVIFSAAGWSMEQVGSELQMKHNNVLKMRFTSTGSIIATEEITAFG